MQQNNNNNTPNQKRRFDPMFLIFCVIIVIGVIMFITRFTGAKTETLTFDNFTTKVVEGNVNPEITASPIGGENYDLYKIKGVFKDTNGKEVNFVMNVTSDILNDIMTGSEYANLSVKIYQLSENIWLALLINLLPVILMVGILAFFIFKGNGANNKAFDFAKSTAKLSRGKTVTFKDVAGCDEEKEELVEMIDFLKNPRKYAEIGARIPKGVLLFGPPGTGKTLLAKAVAGEAGVPFFSISGSDFVEMFVGVGASRVRDMFKTAKENAPCIIFIDEIDAVGRQRGAGMGGGHDEREQTLNQLLVEMDGFNANLGIIVMAATNRPDVLDPALLRPGRFDRQVTISNPDVMGREAILKVHARNKHLNPNINLHEVAQRTPGFSGADIENLLNEAALLAARGNRKVIELTDIDEAIDRVMMGPAKKSKKYTDKERKLVAIHESGHAVIGLKLENANIVQKVTIIPRGQAGGYNLMMPKEETYFRTKSELLDSITGYLGGRVAEEIIFGEVTTGAHNDFQQATRIARAMVTEYGMSDLGPIQYEKPNGSVFLGRDYLKDKNFSDQIALEIDKEVRNIIETCYDKAKKCITENLSLLNTIADYLLKIETLTKSDIDEISSTGALKWYDDKLNAEAKNTNEEIVEEKPVLEEDNSNSLMNEVNETLEANLKNDDTEAKDGE